jgi:protein required for attachment to host cells
MTQLMKSTKWVQKGRPKRRYVFASRTEATVYEPNRKGQFIFISRFSNPDGRRQEGEWRSDRPGTGFSSSARGTIHHGLEREQAHYEHNGRQFAGEVAKGLEKMRVEDRFDELVIAAEPQFLGMLREKLTPGLRSIVYEEIPREFTQGSDEERQAHVLSALAARASERRILYQNAASLG